VYTRYINLYIYIYTLLNSFFIVCTIFKKGNIYHFIFLDALCTEFFQSPSVRCIWMMCKYYCKHQHHRWYYSWLFSRHRRRRDTTNVDFDVAPCFYERYSLDFLSSELHTWGCSVSLGCCNCEHCNCFFFYLFLHFLLVLQSFLEKEDSLEVFSLLHCPFSQKQPKSSSLK